MKMVKGEKMKGKLDYEDEEEGTAKSVIFLSSSDDEEANEDLSLKIVEKARTRELEKKRREEGVGQFEAVDGVRSDAVINLSSCSSDEVEVVCRPSGIGSHEVVKTKKKKKKKKKEKQNNRVDGEENVANPVRDEPQLDTVLPFETIESAEAHPVLPVETIESAEAHPVLPVETIESAEANEADVSDNVVLRKLLRGPRYFDPPDSSWGTCYNCGEEGHKAVNCTVQKRKKPCFVCGSLEHNAKQCTQGQSCFICKRRGHIAKDCPEKHQVSTQGSKICLRCGDTGHDMFSCWNDYSPEDLKEIQCYICKSFGHLCCIDFLDNVPREASCYNCGQSGHTGLGCAISRGKNCSAFSPTFCYKCGEEGHFARGCTNQAKGRWRMGELSTPGKRSWKKDSNSFSSRSAPPDLSKPHKKKSNRYEERCITATVKHKRRGGWMTDDPGDLPYRKSRASGWKSPSTPTQKKHKISALTAGVSPSSSHSPQKRPNFHPGASSSHGSTKAYHQRFSASRFGNLPRWQGQNL